MSSLSQLYKSKDKNGTETTVKKTFLVPLSEIYVEPGFNVREIDQIHVEEFRDAFIAGEYVPPLAVQVTEQGVKIIDGHHRYYGALAAKESGTEIPAWSAKTSLALMPIALLSWSPVLRANRLLPWSEPLPTSA